MKIQFKLRNLILLSVISTIVLSVGLISWIVYSRLQDAILDGFDRKLSAVCTVTSAFLDARTHERLLAPRKIEALAVDPRDGTVYGADSSFGTATLVKIDPASGEAEAVAPLASCPISLTMGPDPGVAIGLFADASGEPTLVEIDLKTGEFGEPKKAPAGSRAIEFHPATGSLFVGGKGILRFPARSGEGEPVQGAAAFAIDEMCFANDRSLVVFNRESLQLTRIDIESGEIGATRFMPLREEYDSVLVGPALAMARHTGDGRLLAATDRLIRVSPDSLEWNDKDIVPGFRSEQAPIYRSYVEPMRSIRERTDLTFLYTQTLSSTGEVIYEGPKRARMNHEDVNKIIYVLDSNTDEDHSPIGYFDEGNPAGEPIRDVYYKGRRHLSKIEKWERWGLIKSGFAPLHEADGQIVGMAGADVSVRKIREKTKIALSTVTLTGIGAILLASLMSILVSRKLTEPIEALKDVALKIAAGQFGERIERTKLRELSHLSDSFNTMGRKLEATVNGLDETNRNWELDRRYSELVKLLTLRNADLNRFHAWVEMLTADAPHHNPSGWTNHGPFVVGWITGDRGGEIENLRFRTGLAAFLFHLIGSAKMDREEIIAHVQRFLGKTGITLFLVDFDKMCVDFRVTGNPVLWSWREGADPKEEPLSSGAFVLETGTQYVICQERALSSHLSAWFRSRPDEEDLVSYFQTRLAEAREAEADIPCGISLNIKAEARNPA